MTAELIHNVVDLSRICKKCGEVKAASEFVLSKQCKRHTCRSCEKLYRRKQDKRLMADPVYNEKRSNQKRAFWKKNPDARRTKDRPDRLKRQYGISSWQEVIDVYHSQEGLCANHGCRKEISLNGPTRSARAVIDHDHETGAFRALLCTKCNLDLGLIEKNINKIYGLLDYLKKHTTEE